jgi:hypothetical protein
MAKQNPNSAFYEMVLTFLSCASRATGAMAKATPTLDGKRAYHKEVDKFQKARQLLRTNYYAFEDWCETGKYIPPEVKTFPVCKECGQITNE